MLLKKIPPFGLVSVGGPSEILDDPQLRNKCWLLASYSQSFCEAEVKSKVPLL